MDSYHKVYTMYPCPERTEFYLVYKHKVIIFYSKRNNLAFGQVLGIQLNSLDGTDS